jgi:pyruvate formate lyase activating enzyme
MIKGIVFDIKRFAIHDGPGIRTTVFLKGCPLECWWCHNPEGQKQEPEHVFRPERCLMDCTDCIEACPQKAVSRVQSRIAIDLNKCRFLGDCANNCPTEALELIGREMTADQVMDEINKDRIFFEESGGGVTFSGGEPLMQPEFLNVLLEKCRANNIHTAVDTSGYAPYEVFLKIQDKVNLFLYDVKMINEKKHKKTTGVSVTLILDNLKKLSENGSNIEARIPVVPGVNNTMKDMTEIAEYLDHCKTIEKISLLPYHNTADHKYKNLNMSSKLAGTKTLEVEKVKKFVKVFEDFGFRVKIGG